MNTLNEALGIVVRRRRLAAGLSQEQLADRSGLHRTYISMIERGLRTATVQTVAKLADALSTTGSELLRDMEGEASGGLRVETERSIARSDR